MSIFFRRDESRCHVAGSPVLPKNKDTDVQISLNIATFKSNLLYVYGLVVGQEKDVSLFLDRTGEPATRHQDSSCLKNKDTSFS